MILYDLKCAQDHGFEAWFKNSATYDEQVAAGAILCPACGDSSVTKAPMAPRLARSRDDAERRPGKAVAGNDMGKIRELLGELRRHVESNCDYVGAGFAEEARKIHYGETEKRNIYGEASEDQARELDEEGIKVGRIPWLPRADS